MTERRRRDWLLNQLGITQWKLRRPVALQREIIIKLSDCVRFLLVTNSVSPETHSLITDVVRSLMFTPIQVARLIPNQVMMLPDNICFHCWWIGLEAMRDFGGLSLCTPSLEELRRDPHAKRDLWRQINNSRYYSTVATSLLNDVTDSKY